MLEHVVRFGLRPRRWNNYQARFGPEFFGPSILSSVSGEDGETVEKGNQVSSGHRRIGLWAGLAFLAIAVGGLVMTIMAPGRWSWPKVASLEGAAVDRLFITFLILTGIVFIFTHVFLGLFVWRFSSRGENDDRKALHWVEDNRLELLWTIIPAAILIVMTFIGGGVWAEVNAPVSEEEGIIVEVWGEQFGWRFRYPGEDGVFGGTLPGLISQDNPLGMVADDPAGDDDIVTLGELKLPVDTPVLFRMKSKDVIHSFFIPALRIKRDLVPGRVVELRAHPTEVGDYEIACAELCGSGHWFMRADLEVMPKEEFEAWLAEQSEGVAE